MDQVTGLNNDKLCVAASIVCEANHFIAYGKCLHPFANSDNDTSQVTALSRGKGRRPALMKQAFAGGCLAGIDAGSLDVDKDLTWTWHRSLDIYDLQYVDIAILMKSNCFWHDVLPSLSIYLV
ncbi:hypothetical protein KSX_72570 [Ktedonospora formicarum]|uniref:Uncharacterized protein n=1 Tax=Ktedonospora formicarum TaxID=2778364 RepID=A0A8J3I491_9CHLR|nr:hypothetical protein KSX_72570 [Ktedonospora formicarum]